MILWGSPSGEGSTWSLHRLTLPHWWHLRLGMVLVLPVQAVGDARCDKPAPLAALLWAHDQAGRVDPVRELAKVPVGVSLGLTKRAGPT